MIGNSINYYCCEDISLIENYELALSDTTQTWVCHHKNEIEMNLKVSELKKLGLYYNRPACELIFLTPNEHMSIHSTGENNPMYGKRGKDNPNYGRIRPKHAEKMTGSGNPMYGKRGKDNPNYGSKRTTKSKEKISEALKGILKPKFQWQTPEGEIVIMAKSMVVRWHPDWVLIGLI